MDETKGTWKLPDFFEGLLRLRRPTAVPVMNAWMDAARVAFGWVFL